MKGPLDLNPHPHERLRFESSMKKKIMRYIKYFQQTFSLEAKCCIFCSFLLRADYQIQTSCCLQKGRNVRLKFPPKRLDWQVHIKSAPKYIHIDATFASIQRCSNMFSFGPLLRNCKNQQRHQWVCCTVGWSVEFCFDRSEQVI